MTVKHDRPTPQPDGATLPDYAGGSLLNLVSTLAAACGAAPSPYAPLRTAHLASLTQARHIVLLLIDGLGDGWLTRFGAGSCLAAHRVATLTSVFPSTTASAITTLMSGWAPQQHGLVGWHLYFRELDTILAALPLQPRGPIPAGFDAAPLPPRLFRHGALYDRLGRPCCVVAPSYLLASPFNRYHSGQARRVGYRHLDELFPAIETCLRDTTAPSFVYAYLPDLDALMHPHGTTHPAVLARFGELDQAFAGFLARIAGSDTAVLVTADHGFIDAPADHRVELDQHPDLAALLARPLCGERRVAYCYLKPGADAAFTAYMATHLAQAAWVIPSRDLVDGHWFGPGTPSPELLPRVGDYTLVMRDDWTIKDWLPGEKHFDQPGVHAGISEAEMRIPLMLAQV